jgi:hypothetical protein
MHAFECDGNFMKPRHDFTTAKGEEKLVLKAASPRGRIIGYNANSTMSQSYIDTNHSSDDFDYFHPNSNLFDPFSPFNRRSREPPVALAIIGGEPLHRRARRSKMSTADAALIALGERFERRLLEYMDAWLAWAPLMRAARAEAESDLAGFTVAIQRTGCDAAQARMSELENDMQPLADEIITAPATSLGGLRVKALVAL